MQLTVVLAAVVPSAAAAASSGWHAAAAFSLAGATAPEQTQTQHGAPTTDVMSDAEILAMLEAISTTGIDTARSAHQRARDHHVKKFAHSLEKRNESAKRRQMELGKHHKLSATGGKAVDEFHKASRQTYSDLGGLPDGPEYDRTFIDDEIESLEHILDLVDNKMLPQVRLHQLRTELNTVSSQTKHDLKKAREVAEQLQKPAK